MKVFICLLYWNMKHQAIFLSNLIKINQNVKGRPIAANSKAFFIYIHSILGRHVSNLVGLFYFSIVSCLLFPLLISVPLLKRLLSHLPLGTVLLWQTIWNFPRWPYQSVCEFCFHRCPSHQMHQSGSSAVEVGFCSGPGSHIWFVLIVQITAASLGREFLSSLTLRRCLKNSFVIHGVFFLLSLWCCKRRRFSTDTFDSSWMYSGDLFRWLFLSEELLEFVRRQDLDRKMRWFHVIQ